MRPSGPEDPVFDPDHRAPGSASGLSHSVSGSDGPVSDPDGHTPGSGATAPVGRFADWACRLSQRTNRSLAGSRLALPQDLRDSDFARQAQQWGMVVTDGQQAHQTDRTNGDGAADDGQNGAASVTVAHNPAGTAVGADSLLPGFDAASAADAPDATALEGEEAIVHAAVHMPVTRTLLARFAQEEPGLRHARIATSLVLEPKTSVFLEALADTGARVGVFCEGNAVDPRVIEPLRRRGVLVEADPSWDTEQSRTAALRLLDDLDPTLVVDDGASFARLMSMERPQMAERVVGVAEETTSGVRAFRKMEAAGALSYPVIAVNDSALKTGFDNAHGTGDTCVTTMQRLLGPDWFDGKKVAVVGYGPVGRGFALRLRALGARVTICDASSVAALRAVFEGFPARDLADVLGSSDMVVSATGERHTLDLPALRKMADGTVVAVIGGILNEIALDEVPGFRPKEGEGMRVLHVPDGPDVRLLASGDGMRVLHVPDGPDVRLLASGDGVNYTVGGGNPIEVMDLSFAVQASAVAYLLAADRRAAQGQDPLPHKVLHLGAQSDERIARIALEVRGWRTSPKAADTGSLWTTTRFTDRAEGE